MNEAVQPSELLDAEAAPPPAAPAPTRPARSPGWVLAAILGIGFILAGLVSALRNQSAGPQPPLANLQDVEPVIADLITKAHQNVRARPTSADAWGLLGKVYRAHEFQDEALQCFRRAAELDPSSPRWPYLIAGGAFAGLGPEETLAYLRRAVQLGGPVLTPKVALAESLIDTGEMAEAARLLEEVAALEPDDPRVHFAQARIAARTNEYPTALAHIERTLAKAPRLKAARMLKGQVLQRLGRTTEAETEFQQARSLAEGWTWPDAYLAEISQVWVGHKARLMRALRLRESGKVEETLDDFVALARDYPDSFHANYSLGQSYNRLGRFSEAEAPLRQALRIDPQSSMAHFELGLSFHQRSAFREAISHYQAAIASKPDTGMIHYNLGLCLEAINDLPGALAALEQAIRYNPEYADGHLQLGRLLALGKRDADAIARLREGLRLKPNDAAALQLLTHLEQRAGRTPSR